ncbi:MAG: hypothetical protein ABS901_06415, partial [Candidatus Limivicinus sp.]
QESAASTSTARTLIRIVLWLLGLPALLAAFLYARYALLRFRRKTRFASAGNNQKAIMLYRDALRVSSFGAEVPVSIRVPAEKAAFSQHEITEAEKKACISALDRVTEETWKSLNRRQQFAFRYLFGNI